MDQQRFRISLDINGNKKSIVARSRSSDDLGKLDEIDTILHIIGLEKVPFKDLVPKCKKVKAGGVDGVCGICTDEYKFREYTRTLDCKHMFHKKCIDKWLPINFTCPLCRQEL